MSIICPYCQSWNQAEARYCSRCGSQLVSRQQPVPQAYYYSPSLADLSEQKPELRARLTTARGKVSPFRLNLALSQHRLVLRILCQTSGITHHQAALPFSDCNTSYRERCDQHERWPNGFRDACILIALRVESPTLGLITPRYA
jgi:hypothetical protein